MVEDPAHGRPDALRVAEAEPLVCLRDLHGRSHGPPEELPAPIARAPPHVVQGLAESPGVGADDAGRPETEGVRALVLELERLAEGPLRILPQSVDPGAPV